MQASWDRICPIGDLEKSLCSVPVFAGGSATYLSQPPVPVAFKTDGTLRYASHTSTTRRRGGITNKFKRRDDRVGSGIQPPPRQRRCPARRSLGASRRRCLNFTGGVAVLSVRPVRVPWRSRILRPCQAPTNCNPDQICTTARFSCRKPHQGQPQASLDSQQRTHSKHRMPRVPTEDNGSYDFLRGELNECG